MNVEEYMPLVGWLSRGKSDQRIDMRPVLLAMDEDGWKRLASTLTQASSAVFFDGTIDDLGLASVKLTGRLQRGADAGKTFRLNIARSGLREWLNTYFYPHQTGGLSDLVNAGLFEGHRLPGPEFGDEHVYVTVGDPQIAGDLVRLTAMSMTNERVRVDLSADPAEEFDLAQLSAFVAEHGSNGLRVLASLERSGGTLGERMVAARDVLN